jgi:hypothetical protein
MSSNNQHSASPSGDRDASLKREDDNEKKRERIDVENQLDEKEEKKEEKKEREVKEDVTAAALPVNDPDLAIGTVDRDLICAICFCFLTNPQSKSSFCRCFLFLLPSSELSFSFFVCSS